MLCDLTDTGGRSVTGCLQRAAVCMRVQSISERGLSFNSMFEDIACERVHGRAERQLFSRCFASGAAAGRCDYFLPMTQPYSYAAGPFSGRGGLRKSVLTPHTQEVSLL